MIETKNFEIDLHEDKKQYRDIAKTRLDNYVEKSEKKKYKPNQFILKDGKALLIISGERYLCTKVEGYIKLPDTGIIMDIKQTNLALFLSGANKLILVYNNDEIICRGYKKFNIKDFMLLLYAETELNYLLITDVTNGDIQPLCLIGDTDYDYTVEILYNQFQYVIEKEIDINQMAIEDLEGRKQHE